ncbi:Holliday junction resolvase RuvX [Amorphus orientalis]|uniref:Putative pre-16S rRNA nuclease n=1 Tax=Amorphus orientalis TaxID=649198 RepID=A0AAE4AT78_9HYPH|nr:Holliday junction resolvase RuvX [Amorphus orientalis]MDQ0317006.1 putative Holliday junction resolvase [Amorphus orientalis]
MTARPDPLLSIEDFVERSPTGSALFGLDLGTKTIGIAVSDGGRRIASPLVTLRRKAFKTDSAELLRLARERSIGGIVLGMPFNMDGSAGPRVQATRAFARNLSELTDLPMLAWDERLSTAAVTRTLIEADASRARRAELVDKVAAAYILQGLLDRLAGLRPL